MKKFRILSRGVKTPLLLYGIIGVVIYFIYSKFVKKDSYTGFQIDGSTQHESDHYKRIADQLYSSMRGMGTKEDQVFGLLLDLRAEDLKSVYNAFGLRNYAWTGNEGFFSEYNLIGNKIDLFGWFAKELNKKERDRMRAIWNNQGIEVTF